MNDEDAARLIRFVADACHNLPTDRGPAEYLTGNEARVLAAFRAAPAEGEGSGFTHAAWNVAAEIAEGRA